MYFVLVMSLFSCNVQYHMLCYPSPYVPSEEGAGCQSPAVLARRVRLSRFYRRDRNGEEDQGTVIGLSWECRVRQISAAYQLRHRVRWATGLSLPNIRIWGARGGVGRELFVDDARVTICLCIQKYARTDFSFGRSWVVALWRRRPRHESL